MQRHEALADLSRDHHHGLVWAKRLKESVEEGDPEQTGRAFLKFWDEELAAHFTEEEHAILPVYQRRVDLREDEQSIEMLADHAWFRDAVPELRARWEASQPVDELVAEIGQRLYDHARFEDRELFVSIEETLTEKELAEVHERSKAFRRQHRGEDAIGPQ